MNWYPLGYQTNDVTLGFKCLNALSVSCMLFFAILYDCRESSLTMCFIIDGKYRVFAIKFSIIIIKCFIFALSQ